MEDKSLIPHCMVPQAFSNVPPQNDQAWALFMRDLHQDAEVLYLCRTSVYVLADILVMLPERLHIYLYY